MDTPVVELPRGFCEGVERGRWPQQNTLQPHGERLDGLGRGARLSVDLDDVGGVAWAVVLGEAGHGTLLQLFDPFNFSLKAVADIDGEAWVLGVENIPLRAPLEGVSVGLDEVFKSIDPRIELAYFGCVVILSLLDRFEQGFDNALQGVGVKVGTAVKDISGRSGRDGVVGECVPRGDGNR